MKKDDPKNGGYFVQGWLYSLKADDFLDGLWSRIEKSTGLKKDELVRRCLRAIRISSVASGYEVHYCYYSEKSRRLWEDS